MVFSYLPKFYSYETGCLKAAFFCAIPRSAKRTPETGENYTGIIEPVFTSKPFVDMEVTLKYPSDGDET
ncbi:microviridin/marinostatin family tricyclic proteinase inhibitor [Paraflavitalea speifideaquila]|uniref:microviridin/marinostatin family tricyclic proteinase inhibitor n=1 Tax=Paraflavitalea speifideaquila TaxID=3076558 RepID=UPI0028E39AA2|nr:microviridin/marinostatin family tricyclic proteinase inhibitor [Paraflavitalea speifideiaquila]